MIAEVPSCPDHSTRGPAPPTYPRGCASLPTRGTWSSPAQMCLGSPIQPPPCCLSQQPGPSGDMLSLPKAVQGLGSPIVVIPALPWGVPVVCGRQCSWGRAAAPRDCTYSRSSTPSLHPAVIEAPSARCWEEDEEGTSASLQGCSQGWPEVARSCLSTLTGEQRG